jgi:AcrR family transcriptional regulator
VAEITAAARVSRNAFYRHFHDKSEVANQALELIFEQVIGACAGAFSSAPQWPERIWRTGRTFASFFATAPDYAHVGMVETHAVGNEMVQLVYDRIGAFALFLEEGYRWRPEAEKLPRITSEAVGATMHEIAFRSLRERRSPAWYAALLPQFVFILLAPFMGPEAALEFVQTKSREAAGP